MRPIGVGSQNTVLDMRAMDSKSNGVLRWGNGSNFGCNIAVNETFYSSLGECGLGACYLSVLTLRGLLVHRAQANGF